MISDRDIQFVNNFCKFIYKRPSINVQLSTTWYSKTNSQTKQLNGVMKQYLRAYVNYLQDDWPDLLPLAEFTGHNIKSETAKVSFFLQAKDSIFA